MGAIFAASTGRKIGLFVQNERARSTSHEISLPLGAAVRRLDATRNYLIQAIAVCLDWQAGSTPGASALARSSNAHRDSHITAQNRQGATLARPNRGLQLQTASRSRRDLPALVSRSRFACAPRWVSAVTVIHGRDRLDGTIYRHCGRSPPPSL